MSRADEFRTNADECRQQAAKAINPPDKERLLKIAKHWLKMAQEEEAELDTGSGQ
jgi:Holliday junction resolvase-like predicted endonuclease